MTTIIGYQKVTDQYTTYRLDVPHDAGCVELCTLAGVTYVALPDGVDLPAQPPKIADSVMVITPDAALRSAIKTASPHCALIKDRGHQRIIDDGFDQEDQRKLDRMVAAMGAGLITLTASQMSVIGRYLATNQAADAWASEQYAALGL